MLSEKSDWTLEDFKDMVMDECKIALWLPLSCHNISSKRGIRTLEQLINCCGKLATICLNNGPEFTSADFTSLCRKKGIHLSHNQPEKPMQNGFIKRFNGSYFRKIRNAYLLIELEEVSFTRFVILWSKLLHKKFFCF